jgi:hypothetical protein
MFTIESTGPAGRAWSQRLSRERRQRLFQPGAWRRAERVVDPRGDFTPRFGPVFEPPAPSADSPVTAAATSAARLWATIAARI